MSKHKQSLLTHRQLLLHLSQLLESDQLEQEIDRIPLIMRPRKNENIRCCVHKDRAVIKYKIMAMLGYNINDESDELTSLSQYVKRHNTEKNSTDKMMTVVDEACSACHKINYTVTNMCRACDARTCQQSCPKDSIDFINGKASINHDTCVNCGLCMKNCSFHAIIYMPVPCEESCPVDAIQKTDEGIEIIDFDKCIYCGKCVKACPFEAIVEKTALPKIFSSIKAKEECIALIAPAIAGQFKASFGKIKQSIKALGFDQVIEVAEGAEMTVAHELEDLQNTEHFVTNSCCTAYNKLIELHVPELKSYQSEAKTPLQYIAEKIKKEQPNSKTVFIGPCISKRYEVYHDQNVDYMMSFEELGAALIAKNIEVTNCEDEELDPKINNTVRQFAVSGGLSASIKAGLPESFDFKPIVFNGINRDHLKQIKKFISHSEAYNFMEVMSCEEGCVGGCNAIAKPTIAKRQINQIIKK